MTRPTSHGGGEAGPPIAGDPSSFPSDAELSRTLVAATKIASLSTLTSEGFPYGSVVSYAADDAGAPVILISEMAEHTVNARGDSRASMLIVDGAGDGDPLGRARLTLVGRLEVLDDPGALRDRYLQTHPYAAYYADFTDFAFWRLDVAQCRYVGGFGHMSWVSADGYRDAAVDPLWEAAAGIIEHMNGDHADANLMYAQVQAGLDDATDAAMVGIDRYGLTLRVTTPAGPRMARVPYGEPLTESDQAQAAVIELLKEARAQRGKS
ncbi:HugZ family protein [Candidatus Poriferisodalis sp.]|uniref:HugZ family pyridoxamine 5'-phosphate oxidase n=1 Tax=Candidatus Poriferisodalis sp. TaxID=3101277 RepID=UPI003B0265E0